LNTFESKCLEKDVDLETNKSTTVENLSSSSDTIKGSKLKYS